MRRGLQLLFNFRNCAYLNSRCHNRAASALSAFRCVVHLARVCNIVATRSHKPFPVRVCRVVVVEKKELLCRGGSQLKRISAPAVEQFSSHRTTLTFLNATPFLLYTDLQLHFQLVLVPHTLFPSFDRPILPTKYPSSHEISSIPPTTV